MPRLRHFDDFGTARAVNFSCYHRHRLLTDEPAIRIFLNECDAMRKHYDIAIVGYVIMPSHVHLVLVPRDHVNLGHAIGELKSRSARRILALWRELQAPVRASYWFDGEESSSWSFGKVGVMITIVGSWMVSAK